MFHMFLWGFAPRQAPLEPDETLRVCKRMTSSLGAEDASGEEERRLHERVAGHGKRGARQAKGCGGG